MLYLIRTFGRGKKKTALKIGYSDNLTDRFNSYKIHNPFFEVVSTRMGDKLDEVIVHLYLKSLGYKEQFLNEWFIDDNNVLQKFHDGHDKMLKVIWTNRANLFTEEDFKNKKSVKLKVYEELLKTHELDNLHNPIDSAYLKEQNMEFFRQSRKEKSYIRKLYM